MILQFSKAKTARLACGKRRPGNVEGVKPSFEFGHDLTFTPFPTVLRPLPPREVAFPTIGKRVAATGGIAFGGIAC